MRPFIKRFLKCESGATAIEYALLAALISVAIIAGAQLLGTEINTTFNDVKDTLSDARSSGWNLDDLETKLVKKDID